MKDTFHSHGPLDEVLYNSFGMVVEPPKHGPRNVMFQTVCPNSKRNSIKLVIYNVSIHMQYKGISLWVGANCLKYDVSVPIF